VLGHDVQVAHRADLLAPGEDGERDVGRRRERLVEPGVEAAIDRVAKDRRVVVCGRAQPVAVPLGKRLDADDPADERLVRS
jgi:hypothetical protein